MEPYNPPPPRPTPLQNTPLLTTPLTLHPPNLLPANTQRTVFTPAAGTHADTITNNTATATNNRAASPHNHAGIPEVRSLLASATSVVEDLKGEMASKTFDNKTKMVANAIIVLFTLTEAIANAVVPWMEEQDDSDSDETSIFTSNASRDPCANSSRPPHSSTAHCQDTQHSIALNNCLDSAERSAILFDCNLGRLPTANRDNLTFALWSGVKTAAISKAEREGTNASSAIKLVDDAVSCVTSTEFLGTRSTPYVNKQHKDDPRNNNFCSMPVKLTFRDRGSRINFEQIMRTFCDLRATISLPKPIRELRTSLAEDVRSNAPNCFVSIRLNSEKQSLIALTKKNASSQWEQHSVRKIPPHILHNPSC